LLLAGVCGVVLRDDLEPGRQHLLLTRRTDTGRWALPAGIVEPGEQPAATLVRELWEETRVVATVERLTWLATDPEQVYANGDRCQYVSMGFRCRYVSGEAQVGDDESLAVAWFPTDALPELDPVQQLRVTSTLAGADTCRFEH
jgi:8-oxo-dGTP pyrophosphatase MutT (NUDIX family)